MQMAEYVETRVDEIKISSSSLGNTDEEEPFSALEILSLLDSLYLQSRCFASMGFITEVRKFALTTQELSRLLLGPDAMTSLSIVGSFAEGIYLPGHSDMDAMASYDPIICCDVNDVQHINPSRYNKVLIADTQHSSPGYTLLLDLGDQFIEQARNDSICLTDHVKKIPNIPHVALKQTDIYDRSGIRSLRQGPALQLYSNYETYTAILFKLMGYTGPADAVSAICYECHDIKQCWLDRKRFHGWPSEELQKQISETQGHVVSVGRKGSPYEEYEWRICYTEAEIKLVHSLNEVQLMLYFKLKLFSKTVLKDACPDITSYIIKNVIFWLAESVPKKYFQFRYFIPLFRATLVCLRKFVRNRYLPNYMIPKRNLFAGKLTEHEQEKLVRKLSNWIDNYSIFEGERKGDILLYENMLQDLDGQIYYLFAMISIVRAIRSNLNGMVQHLRSFESNVGGVDNVFFNEFLRYIGLTDTEVNEIINSGRLGDVQAGVFGICNSKHLNLIGYTIELLFLSM